MPSNYPGGIGDEECMWYWYNGQEGAEGDRITEAKVVSKTDSTALVNVTYLSFGNPQIFKLNLIKEKHQYPNGLEIEKWVVDDFCNYFGDWKRPIIFDYVNTVGNDFKQGLAKRLLNDPEIGGYMSESEKRKYLEEVDKFLKEFNKTYPDGVYK